LPCYIDLNPVDDTNQKSSPVLNVPGPSINLPSQDQFLKNQARQNLRFLILEVDSQMGIMRPLGRNNSA